MKGEKITPGPARSLRFDVFLVPLVSLPTTRSSRAGNPTLPRPSLRQIWIHDANDGSSMPRLGREDGSLPTVTFIHPHRTDSLISLLLRPLIHSVMTLSLIASLVAPCLLQLLFHLFVSRFFFCFDITDSEYWTHLRPLSRTQITYGQIPPTHTDDPVLFHSRLL